MIVYLDRLKCDAISEDVDPKCELADSWRSMTLLLSA